MELLPKKTSTAFPSEAVPHFAPGYSEKVFAQALVTDPHEGHQGKCNRLASNNSRRKRDDIHPGTRLSRRPRKHMVWLASLCEDKLPLTGDEHQNALLGEQITSGERLQKPSKVPKSSIRLHGGLCGSFGRSLFHF